MKGQQYGAKCQSDTYLHVTCYSVLLGQFFYECVKKTNQCEAVSAVNTFSYV